MLSRDGREHRPGVKRGAVAPPKRRWFSLQALDPVTGCPVLEARFAVADLSALRAVLGSDAEDGPDLERGYYVDGDGLRTIAAAFGVGFEAGDRDVLLEPFRAEGIREAPYLVHTGFELALMLEGRKPLAIFLGHDPCEWLDGLMRRFDPFVAERRFVRRKVTVPMQEPWRAPGGGLLDRYQQIYIALRGEEWRIDASILLRAVVEKSGWNEALERFEGSLLGYEDWQNDWWLRRQRARRRDTWGELFCGAGRP